MDFYTFLIQLLNGVQYGLLLFLVSSGLTLVFGIMGIINVAHGSFYMRDMRINSGAKSEGCAAADEAVKLLEDGFRGVKLRLGRPTLAADLAAVRAVRKRLPDGVELMVDFNQALSIAEALERGRALDSEGIAWIEEPIRHDNFRGCAELARELATPIQIGENFSLPEQMEEALAAEACDFVMPDLERIVGVSGWQHAAKLAEQRKLPMSSHLFPETSAHLLAVTPTCHYLEYVDWADAILAEPLRIVGGEAVIPDRPGTGVAWDEKAVKRYEIA